jgi:ribosomal protein S27E
MRRSEASRDDIRVFLRDRKWHKIVDIVIFLGPLVKSYRASQVFCRHTGGRSNVDAARAARGEKPIDEQARRGRLKIVSDMVTDMKRNDLVETRGTGVQREVRLLEWFCWNCKALNTSTEGKEFELKLCHTCYKMLHVPKGYKAVIAEKKKSLTHVKTKKKKKRPK